MRGRERGEREREGEEREREGRERKRGRNREVGREGEIEGERGR